MKVRRIAYIKKRHMIRQALLSYRGYLRELKGQQ